MTCFSHFHSLKLKRFGSFHFKIERKKKRKKETDCNQTRREMFKLQLERRISNTARVSPEDLHGHVLGKLRDYGHGGGIVPSHQ